MLETSPLLLLLWHHTSSSALLSLFTQCHWRECLLVLICQFLSLFVLLELCVTRKCQRYVLVEEPIESCSSSSGNQICFTKGETLKVQRILEKVYGMFFCEKTIYGFLRTVGNIRFEFKILSSVVSLILWMQMSHFPDLFSVSVLLNLR